MENKQKPARKRPNPGIGLAILVLSMIDLLLIMAEILTANGLTIGGGILGFFVGCVITLQDL